MGGFGVNGTLFWWIIERLLLGKRLVCYGRFICAGEAVKVHTLRTRPGRHYQGCGLEQPVAVVGL